MNATNDRFLSSDARQMRLIEACVLGNVPAVCDLLAGGVGADEPTNFGYTPLHFASNAGRREVVKVLLQAGADPTRRSSTAGVAPLDLARLAGHQGVAFELLQALRAHAAGRQTSFELLAA